MAEAVPTAEIAEGIVAVAAGVLEAAEDVAVDAGAMAAVAVTAAAMEDTAVTAETVTRAAKSHCSTKRGAAAMRPFSLFSFAEV
jgi:hypothetical protein